MFKCLISFGLCLFIFLSTLSSSKAQETIEYKLASINAGNYVSKDHITVARFSRLLSQLSYTYIENKQQIADMSVRAHELLKNDGVKVSLVTIMEGLNQLFSMRVENQRYAEYIAAYITLRDKGQSHQEAIRGIQGVLRAIGVY